jgi:ATP phosphoribosyltransferase
LRANHLQVLADGLILQSQATLWRSRIAPMEDSERDTLRALMRLIT